MKKLMILGAGIYQVPLIYTAKEMGIYTIVLSYRGKYPGFNLADKVYYIDTTDSDKVLKTAQNEKIDGICTAGTDVAMASIGRVVSTMQLPGPSWESTQLVTNKHKMKKAFLEHGIRTAEYRTVTSIEEARLAYDLLKDFDSEARVVFKVLDSSGSRGIVIVSENNQIESAYRQVMEITKESYFIVEQFLDGIEFGAQALIHNNEIKFFITHGDIVYKSDIATVPIGHYLPCGLSHKIVEDARAQLKYSITATGIDNCAVNVDYILCDNNVYMLEIGARAGATCLPELIDCYAGISYYKEIIKLALGMSPHIEETTKQPCAAQLICSDRTGTIKKIELNGKYQTGLVDLKFDVTNGDLVRRFLVGPDRIGHVVVKGNSVEEAQILISETLNNITIDFE